MKLLRILSQKQALDHPCIVRILVTAYYFFFIYAQILKVLVIAVVTVTALFYFAFIFLFFSFSHVELASSQLYTT